MNREELFEKYYMPHLAGASDEEISKLIELDKRIEENWNLSNKLESERGKMRQSLKPNLPKEKSKHEENRNRLLIINSEKVKELKEERRQIHQNFKLATKYLRDSRKKQLSEDPELSKNLIEKRIAWDNLQEAQSKFHKMFDELKEKFANREVTEGEAK